MKSNLILVFLLLAPMVQHLLTSEAKEERSNAAPAQSEVAETKCDQAKPVARKVEADPKQAPASAPAPAPSAGGSLEPAQRLPAQDTVTFM